MKLKNLLLSGVAVALMGFVAMGCNENPTDPIGSGGPAAPTNLKAVSLATPGSVNGTSVGLSWTASVDTGVTYTVTWKEKLATVDAGTMTALTTTATTVTNLATGKEYVFTVTAVRGTDRSSAATINWAPAQRYTTEPGGTVTLRMYEFASSNGSGLTLDPGMGGPRNVKVADPPNPNSVQLAIYTKGPALPDSFDIAPAYAIVEFKGANTFDINTYISDSSYVAASLNDWYYFRSLDTRIPADGNVRYFRFPNSESGSMGRGFFVRTGIAGNYHYARVFVKNVGGKFLQGSAGNRFVEVEISYQASPNLPYAKRRVAESPAAGVSRVSTH